MNYTKHNQHSSSNIVLAIGALLLSAGTFAVAQTAQPTTKPNKFQPSTDVSIGVDGQVTLTRSPTTNTSYSNGTEFTRQDQSTSDSGGGSATFHQSFRPWLGYNVNFGFNRFVEDYKSEAAFTPTSTPGVSTLSYSNIGAIRTNMYDLTVAYVFEGPRRKRFNTFGQFGGGGLFFRPADNSVGAKNQIRPAMVFGGGVNYKLTSRLDLRAEYRGLFYKSPDFTIPSPAPGYDATHQFPMSRLFTVTSTPVLSLVYHFGRTR